MRTSLFLLTAAKHFKGVAGVAGLMKGHTFTQAPHSMHVVVSTSGYFDPIASSRRVMHCFGHTELQAEQPLQRVLSETTICLCCISTSFEEFTYDFFSHVFQHDTFVMVAGYEIYCH